jgi:DNA-binding XRE family transcriptional regulator
MKYGSAVDFDGKKVKGYILAQSKSISQFARTHELKRDVLAHVLAVGRCSEYTLTRIADGLGRQPKEFFKDVVITDKEMTIPLAYRLAAKMTRRELAAKAGLSTGAIERLERGDGECSVFTAACASRALGLPMGRYLGYED